MESTDHTFEAIVVGGGQTGLIVGHALKTHGVDFTILDASQRIGDAWRHRWDSLRLFTQAFMNGLPGKPFPGPHNAFVGKDEVADFLEAYAKELELPVQSGVRVERLSRDGEHFTVETNTSRLRARNVIVAMADYQKPHLPAFAAELDQSIAQLHSSAYQNPTQLSRGPVLVVGLGNSGADIALDVSASHDTTVAGTESGAVPFKIEGLFGRFLGTRLVRFMMVRVLNTSTPIGRRARPKMLVKGPPLVRVRPKELRAAGVRRVGRITGVQDGKPVTDDGEVLNPATVIWCTGYRPGFDWIDLPVFDDNGSPQTRRGVVQELPGLYFVGLFFLHSMWSETITGAQPDVAYVVRHLMEHRLPTPQPA